MMKKIFPLLLIFSINVFSQGFNRSKDFYEKDNFIEITRSAKPVQKSLYNYAAYTHDQKGSTCVTHAIAQGMTILYSLRKKSSDRAVNSLNSFSPYFTYVNITNDPDEGMFPTDGLDYVSTYGNPLITFVEYDEYYPWTSNIITSLSKISSSKIKNAKENAEKFKLKKYKQLLTIDGIKQSISQNYPVLYCIDYTPESIAKLYDCEASDCFWEPNVNEKTAENLFGHAMLIVGYDDDKGAVEVLNSWGKDFGNNGFFWIKYEDVFTGFIHYEDCYMDIGTGNCFSWEDHSLMVKYSINNIEQDIIDYENYIGQTMPRGNGFGSEAYSLQGISFDESVFWEDKQYIPQSLRKVSKTSILNNNPEYKNSDWFMKFDDLLNDIQ